MKRPISWNKRLQFEQVFCQELDQIDELNNLAGSDLGDDLWLHGCQWPGGFVSAQKANCRQCPKAVQRQLAGCKAVLTGESPAANGDGVTVSRTAAMAAGLACKRRRFQAVLPVAHPVFAGTFTPACPNTFWA
jgi:hypothetical protein